jgi:hypothetical protein
MHFRRGDQQARFKPVGDDLEKTQDILAAVALLADWWLAEGGAAHIAAAMMLLRPLAICVLRPASDLFGSSATVLRHRPLCCRVLRSGRHFLSYRRRIPLTHNGITVFPVTVSAGKTAVALALPRVRTPSRGQRRRAGSRSALQWRTVLVVTNATCAWVRRSRGRYGAAVVDTVRVDRRLVQDRCCVAVARDRKLAALTTDHAAGTVALPTDQLMFAYGLCSARGFSTHASSSRPRTVLASCRSRITFAG